jgi:hypothetical protein
MNWILLYHRHIRPSTYINPNYAAIVKQYIDKLLAIRFIQSLKEATWLSPIGNST